MRPFESMCILRQAQGFMEGAWRKVFVVWLAHVRWEIGSYLLSPVQSTATVGGTMPTLINESAGVIMVFTLGACTGGGGGGPMLVVLFCLGVVGAMGLGFFVDAL